MKALQKQKILIYQTHQSIFSFAQYVRDEVFA